MKKYNFISGLPRAGSTLLSSILRQNPRFTANISDPLQQYVHSIIRETSASVGMESTVNIPKRREIIHGMFDSFYSDANEVCFNTNRGWAADTALLKDLFPDFKMIVCVREIPWILDSFEVLNSKNPYTIKPLYHHQELGSVYERTHMLMGNVPNFAGYVAGPLNNVKQSLFCAERDQILYIEYDALVSNPAAVMEHVYKFLGEPFYLHDFDNVENSYDEFDEQAKIEGLHKVRRKVEWINRDPILPTDLWVQYSSASFWKEGFEPLRSQLNWLGLEQKPVINNNIARQL